MPPLRSGFTLKSESIRRRREQNDSVPFSRDNDVRLPGNDERWRSGCSPSCSRRSSPRNRGMGTQRLRRFLVIVHEPPHAGVRRLDAAPGPVVAAVGRAQARCPHRGEFERVPCECGTVQDTVETRRVLRPSPRPLSITAREDAVTRGAGIGSTGESDCVNPDACGAVRPTRPERSFAPAAPSPCRDAPD